MSDLLNSASLVMIPSGYKEDTVYSVVPSDGSGDLSFTRASNGTRVNSAGLVEVVAWNLVQYSEDFSNGVWTTTSTTITADNTTAPNGTATADKVEISSSTNAIVQQIINSNLITGGLPCTFSVYIKSVSGTGNVGIRSGQTGLSSVFSYTNQWQRFEWTFNAYALSEIMQFCNNTLVGGADSAPSFYAWGAQLNIGSTAKPYFPTTDRLNVPRLTYQNGGGGCPSLLLEKQSTNLQLYSQELDNAYWNTYNLTVTGNNGISPDGTQNADTLTFDANATARLEKPVGGTYESQTHTVSVYAKVTSGTQQFRLKCTHANVADYYSSDLTVTTEWQRFTFTQTFGASVGTGIVSGVINSSSGTAKSILFYGFQLEANSSYATSYIPTTSSSATRVADVATKSSISSLFGASATSLFMDFEITQVSNDATWTVTGYDGSNLFSLCQFGATTNFPRIVFDGGVDTTLGTALSIGRHKIAVSFATNDFRAYIDGALVLTDTSCTYNRYDRIAVNGTAWTGNTNNNNSFKLNQYAQFPTALTNAELASLTTI